MERFERREEGAGAERLQGFIKILWDVLVPANGECASVQGELVRANGRLATEYFRNAMGNYYDDEDGDAVEDTFFGKLLVFMLETLIANRNRALDDEDVAYFADVRRLAGPDWVRRRRLEALEDKADASDAEREELQALETEDADRGFWWDDLFDRAERCIANWCIANHELIDREDRPIQEAGISDVLDL